MQTNIFFNEKLHKYTDENNNVYTSVTTLIKQFEKEFDRTAEAKACAERGKMGKGRYVGMTEEQILKQWDKITKESQKRGTKQHNELEETIKLRNNYKLIKDKFINSRIYTIDDIINDYKVGILDVDSFIKSNIAKKFPDFAEVVINLYKEGYRLYPEICTYNKEWLIAGLIDLLLLNHDTKDFIIIDYKTNKKRLEFRSGYYKKTYDGRYTDEFVSKQDYFKIPINNIPYSKGNVYNLQLSTYAYLTELKGLKLVDLLLFHIKPETNDYGDVINTDNLETMWYGMSYFKNEVIKMINYHYNKNVLNKVNTQIKLQLGI